MVNLKNTTGDCGRTPVMFHSAEHPDEGTLSTRLSWNSDDDMELSYGANRITETLPIASMVDEPSDEDIDNSPSNKLLTLNLLIVPFMFCHILGLYTLLLIRNSLFMNKACLYFLEHPIEICGNLSSHQSILNEVQQVANDYALYVTMIVTVPSTIISVFVGGWSNEHLRKGRVLISLFGLIFIEMGFLLNSIFMEWPLFYVLIISIPAGLLGGPPIATTYAYTFVCDKFSLESRTLLYASLQTATTVGALGASFFSGQLFKYFGYEAVYGLAVASHSLCFLYILFCTKTSKSFGEQGFKALMTELFSFSALLENFGAYTKKRKNNGRLEISLLTLALVIVICIQALPADVLFLFCNKMFSWDFSTYSNVNAISMIATIAVTLTVTPICTKLLSLKDSAIGLVGTLSILVQYLLFGVSYQEWIFYIAIATGIFSDFAVFAILARLSKAVSVEEVGQVFAIAASTESLSPLLESVLATRIYNATINIYPGLTLIFMAVLLLFPFCLFTWTLRTGRENAEEERRISQPTVTDNAVTCTFTK